MLKKFKIFIWTLILFGSVSCVDNDNTDCPDRRLKIIICNADDDVQFTGSLVDHLYVDLSVCEGRKDSCGSSAHCLHAAAYDCDHSEVGL